MEQKLKTRQGKGKGFTLVELLVVVAIIALLVSILLPSLGAAKELARQTVCAANMRSVGSMLMIYTTIYDRFPASYAYPCTDGTWGTGSGDQDTSKPRGYLHWSKMVLGRNYNEKFFQCPSMKKGGAPRTNPGPQAGDWEKGQIDDLGNTSPNGYVDQQPARVGFVANAAIIPRNKFTTGLAYGGPRVNRLVCPDDIRNASGTILATEFNNNWRAVAISQGGGGLLVKSHRPIQPFCHLSLATKDVYNDALNHSGFIYPDPNDLMSAEGINEQNGLIASNIETNAVGRHHIGKDLEVNGNDMGGSANFLYCDGHVECKHVHETIKNREWGDKFYSITGKNEVLP